MNFTRRECDGTTAMAYETGSIITHPSMLRTLSAPVYEPQFWPNLSIAFDNLLYDYSREPANEKLIL